MEILEKELPQKDLEGQTIGVSKNFTLDLKKGQDVTQDFIAEQRNRFNIAYFLYKRKKSRWLTLNETINTLIILPLPETIEEKYLKQPINSNCKIDDMLLKPLPNNMAKLVMSRILSVICFLVCLLVIATEATSLFDHKYSFLYWVSSYFMTSLDHRGASNEHSIQHNADDFLNCKHYSSLLLHSIQLKGIRFHATSPRPYRLSLFSVSDWNVL